ncbi:MAG: SDR family oxidoreductase [Rhodospirillaceae bacterium]|nr:SDR family oxidoreductase [Rhodospirillales bacterium]
MKPVVLLLGATSDMGRAVARAYAAQGHPLHLAARDAARLALDAEDLRLRSGVDVWTHPFDVLAEDAASIMTGLAPPPSIVICFVGMMGTDPQLIMRTNYTGPAMVLEAAADFLQRQGGGVLVGVSSVAGDRGRAGNYVYGSAKAGLTAYLSGLRARLHGSKVRVVTVKPGFVHTRMTEGMDLPKALTAQPDEVARAIMEALEQGRDVVYVRPVWRLIMTIIRLLPEPVFKRLRI